MTNKSKKNPLIRDIEKRESIPIRNKYVGGVCPTCKNDYVDLELHHKRYPDHKK